MSANVLEKIWMEGSAQWVLVRGKSLDLPLLLQVQAGPGLPMISEANKMEKLHRLEQDFLVAYWDQRGCGKSFSNELDPTSMTLSQLTSDVVACTEYLLRTYNKKAAVVVGYSLGATLSLWAAQRRPELYSDLFLVGVDIDLPSANRHAVAFAHIEAVRRGNTNWIRTAIALQQVAIDSADLFQKRAKLLSNVGGIMVDRDYTDLLLTTLRNLINCRYYRWSDIIRTIRGMSFCQNALLKEMNTVNLFGMSLKVELPVHFLQGKQDGVAPWETAERYFDLMESPSKSFTLFEHAAHMPHMEKPEQFAQLVREKSRR